MQRRDRFDFAFSACGVRRKFWRCFPTACGKKLTFLVTPRSAKKNWFYFLDARSAGTIQKRLFEIGTILSRRFEHIPYIIDAKRTYDFVFVTRAVRTKFWVCRVGMQSAEKIVKWCAARKKYWLLWLLGARQRQILLA